MKSNRTNLWKTLHEDQRGAVSIETVLILAAIALPVLIFIIKFGWPRVRNYFDTGMDQLTSDAQDAKMGASE
jgi:hypothetical protein